MGRDGEEGGWGAGSLSATLTLAACAAALVSLAACAAGATVGVLGIDAVSLEVCRAGGESEQRRRWAESVWGVYRRHHHLLCTLLVVNAAANEALPLVLDRLVPPWAAVLASVTLVLVFGEVVPSAVFTGPKQLELAARAAPGIKAAMWLTSPVSLPLAKLLDAVLGAHHGGAAFDRRQLASLVGLQGGTRLSEDEVTIIRETLSAAHKTARDAMTPFRKVHMMPLEGTALDEATIADIVGSGHSRIPVYRNGDRHDVVGVLRVKSLIVTDPDEARPLDTFPLRPPLAVRPSAPLLELLNAFQLGRCHLALVTEQADELQARWKREATRHAARSLSGAEWASGSPRAGAAGGVTVQGIITVEDVLEELIGEEIEDEDDFGDSHLERLDTNLRRIAVQQAGVRRAAAQFKRLLHRRRARQGRGSVSVDVGEPGEGDEDGGEGAADQPLLRALGAALQPAEKASRD